MNSNDSIGTLRAKGINKTVLDRKIVATVLDDGETLVTNDGALPDGTIPGLSVENWTV
jgi:hypothetical protein